METIEKTSAEEIEGSVMQSLIHLLGNSSILRIQSLECIKYCKRASAALEDMKMKRQVLSTSKSYLIQTRNDLLVRNKINSTNLSSLFQTQNELYNYKCEVKTDYIKTEEKMRKNKIKLDSIISSYQMKWESTEKEYHKLPMVQEIIQLQKENNLLLADEKALVGQFEKTERNYCDLYRNSRINLTKKIIEFIREYKEYQDYIQLSEKIRGKKIKNQQPFESLEIKEKPKKGNYCDGVFFRANTLHLDKSDRNGNKNPTFSADLTMFDNIMIPIESLELQNEEDLFPYPKNSAKNSEAVAEQLPEYNVPTECDPNENSFVSKKESPPPVKNNNYSKESGEDIPIKGFKNTFLGQTNTRDGPNLCSPKDFNLGNVETEPCKKNEIHESFDNEQIFNDKCSKSTNIVSSNELKRTIMESKITDIPTFKEKPMKKRRVTFQLPGFVNKHIDGKISPNENTLSENDKLTDPKGFMIHDVGFKDGTNEAGNFSFFYGRKDINNSNKGANSIFTLF